MKKILTIILTMMALAGCSSRPQPVTVGLTQAPGAEYTGFYLAVQDNMYTDAGIDVRLRNLPGKPISQVLRDGLADVVVTTLSDALMAKADGLDIVNVCQTSQSSAMTLICKSSIDSLQNLNGGRAGYFDRDHTLAVCKAFSAIKGLDIEWVPLDSYLDFLDGELDAVAVLEYGDYYLLTGEGSDVNIYSFRVMGFDVPEDGIYCLADTYKKNKAGIDLFVQQTTKAWDRIAEDVNVGYVAMATQLTTSDEEELKGQFWNLTRVMYHQQDPVFKKATYLLDPSTELAAIDIFTESGQLQKSVTVIP